MSIASAHSSQTKPSGKLGWAGYALGFSLGGFFDGILLHQILQWHHLLSGLEQARQDIRTLILADGLFHALMYVIAAAGLWLLWRGRGELTAPGSDRRLIANALIGFGVWHVADAVLSHWVLGIHRIRMGVETPLLWDLLWLAVFGLIPLAAGWFWRGGSSRGAPGAPGMPICLAVATALAGPVAALPPSDETVALVLFRPDVSPAQAFAAMDAVQGQLVWSDPTNQLWAIDLPEGTGTAALYRRGALLVSRSLLPAGCFNWTKLASNDA